MDYQIAMHISVITYLKDEAKEIFHLVFKATCQPNQNYSNSCCMHNPKPFFSYF